MTYIALTLQCLTCRRDYAGLIFELTLTLILTLTLPPTIRGCICIYVYMYIEQFLGLLALEQFQGAVESEKTAGGTSRVRRLHSLTH